VKNLGKIIDLLCEFQIEHPGILNIGGDSRGWSIHLTEDEFLKHVDVWSVATRTVGAHEPDPYPYRLTRQYGNVELFCLSRTGQVAA
jgi:hypothetical protein